VVTVFLMTFGITALGVGLGAVFPRFRYENVAQIPTGFGGIVYMLVTLLFIGAVVSLEAWPVYRIVTAQTAGATLSAKSLLRAGSSFGVVLLLVLAVIIIPMKTGLKSLLSREM
jgi:ABC-2 type transport system permease protein